MAYEVQPPHQDPDGIQIEGPTQRRWLPHGPQEGLQPNVRPVASRNIIRLLLILVLVHSWHTIQLDYVLAFTQALVNQNLYMNIPKGFEVEGAKRGEYFLKIKKNTYRQKNQDKSGISTCVPSSRKLDSSNPSSTNVYSTRRTRSMSSTPMTASWQVQANSKSRKRSSKCRRSASNPPLRATLRTSLG